ncbi:hypothetical protein JXA32_06735 [Candidatus Sumerlaeota bacterium]|nr:hypothetical protein [Candidatus Sumerlaeota bacterium]
MAGFIGPGWTKNDVTQTRSWKSKQTAPSRKNQPAISRCLLFDMMSDTITLIYPSKGKDDDSENNRMDSMVCGRGFDIYLWNQRQRYQLPCINHGIIHFLTGNVMLFVDMIKNGAIQKVSNGNLKDTPQRYEDTKN